jgi:Protein of unknown function (DUF2973)
MLLHLLYIAAFTIVALLAMSNLIRSMVTLGMASQRPYGKPQTHKSISHPELLDESGNLIDEPLLVMRSFTMEDARAQLDALYRDSPGKEDEARGEI